MRCVIFELCFILRLHVVRTNPVIQWVQFVLLHFVLLRPDDACPMLILTTFAIRQNTTFDPLTVLAEYIRRVASVFCQLEMRRYRALNYPINITDSLLYFLCVRVTMPFFSIMWVLYSVEI